MEPILLIGANGQLGTDLRRTLPAAALIPLARTDLDVTDPGAVERALATHAPAWVINTAAYHRVDDIETKDASLAFAVNEVAVGHLAQACTRRGARLLHLSTDYVFGGGLPGNPPRPYTEEAPPAPLSVYGAIEAGRRAPGPRREPAPRRRPVVGPLRGRRVRGQGGQFRRDDATARSAGQCPPGRRGSDPGPDLHGRPGRGDRPRSSPQIPRGGLYHLTNAGACSWFEFASQHLQALPALTRSQADDERGIQGQAPAPRPPYSVLANTRAAALGLPPLRPWSEALDAYLRAKGHLAD